MLRFWSSLLAAGLLTAGSAGTAGSQDTTSTWQLIPLLFMGLHVTSEPRGHSSLVLGLGLGAERPLGPRVALRAFAAGYRHSLGTAGHDLGFEYPDFPHHEVAGGVDAILLPTGRTLRFVLGGGITYVLGSSKPYRGSAVVDTTIGPRLMLRGGIEIALGRSARAPRIHYVRNVYAKSFLSAKWLDTFGVLFPR